MFCIIKMIFITYPIFIKVTAFTCEVLFLVVNEKFLRIMLGVM